MQYAKLAMKDSDFAPHTQGTHREDVKNAKEKQDLCIFVMIKRLSQTFFGFLCVLRVFAVRILRMRCKICILQ
jgi:hypothetical protein